jgi:multiple antibiotic resistance protein
MPGLPDGGTTWTLTSAAILLFFVMDPLGNTPLFLTALREVPRERRRRVLLRELLVALLAMLVFLFAGRFLLRALQVSSAALTTSGGFVLLLIAIRMIFPSAERSLREPTIREPFVFPLAIPYTAGPSVLTTELLLMSREPERWPTWMLAIFLAWLASAAILFFGSGLERFLGERGLAAPERLMGMILAMLAVEMILRGVAAYIAS